MVDIYLLYLENMTADDILDNDVTDGFVFTSDHHTQPKQVHIALGGSSKH